MNSTWTCVYETEREAIQEATKDAKEWAKDNDMNCYAEVALWSGDMLVIKSTPSGEITRSKSGGWNRGGLVYMSRRVAKVYGIR